MPVPSAVISVAISCWTSSLSKRAFSTLRILPLQRQDRLELAVAPLLGRAAGGVALDDVQLAQRRILLLAVGQLAGQAQPVQDALAAGHLARLARRLAGPRGLDDLAAMIFGIGRAVPAGSRRSFSATTSSTTGRALRTRPACPWSGRLNLGSGTFTDSTQARPSRMSSPVVSTLAFLAQLVVVDVLVDDAGHRRAQAGEVRAAIASAGCCW
jgi:hypothetical protein